MPTTTATQAAAAPTTGGGTAALGHLPALDGLRGIAAVTVLLNHAGVHVPLFGVEVFFALSGYLITRLLAAELHATGRLNLRRFYTRRAYRLWPAFALMLVCAQLLNSLGTEPTSAADMAISGGYVANLFRAAGHDIGALGHTWSLAAEEQFYLLWPVLLGGLVWRLPAHRRHQAVTAAVLGVAVWRGWLWTHGASWYRIYNGPDTHADAILAGCALALAPRLPAWCRHPLALPVGIGLGWLGFQYPDTATCMTFAAAGSVLLVGWVLGHGHTVTGRLLGTRPARWLGRLSYGIYLWHYPLLHVLPAGHPWLLLACTLVVAACSYRWVEQPMLARRDRRARQHRPEPRLAVAA